MRSSKLTDVLFVAAYLAFVFYVSLLHFRHNGMAAITLNMTLRIPIYALLTVLVFLLLNAFCDHFTLKLPLACLLATAFGLLSELYQPVVYSNARLLTAACLNAAGAVIGGLIVRLMRNCFRNEFSDVINDNSAA